MVAPTGPQNGLALDGYYFDPVTRCCTYLPDLPNFLVGGILSDTDPAAEAGRATVEQRIAAGIGVSPLGLAPSPVFTLLYRNSEGSFGKSRTLACPHLLKDTGQCGIWRHRNSVCATWFCKHVRGKLGRGFWIDSLHPLLQIVETELSRWCVLEMHLATDALRHLISSETWTTDEPAVTGDSIDGRVNQKHYGEIWGEWRGHEAEFFRRCAGLVQPLSWTDVISICGPQSRALAQLTQQAWRRLVSEDIPPTVETGEIKLVRIRNATARVVTYSGYDPLDVPADLMELLYYFDGRPTEDALTAIAEERGFRIEPDLLRKLFDFGLLVPGQDRRAEPPDSPRGATPSGCSQ